jgi:hypothetical protein
VNLSAKYTAQPNLTGRQAATWLHRGLRSLYGWTHAGLLDRQTEISRWIVRGLIATRRQYQRTDEDPDRHFELGVT